MLATSFPSVAVGWSDRRIRDETLNQEYLARSAQPAYAAGREDKSSAAPRKNDDRTVARTYRAAIRIGEDFITLEETIAFTHRCL